MKNRAHFLVSALERLFAGGHAVRVEDRFDVAHPGNALLELAGVPHLDHKTVLDHRCVGGAFGGDDVFIEWRIKQLINEGRIQVNGDIEKGWKDFDVKLEGGKKAEAIVDENLSEN